MFTFSVGQHNYDVTPLQWIACANKGERETDAHLQHMNPGIMVGFFPSALAAMMMMMMMVFE